MTRTTGFTLIEVLLVVLIIGMLAAVLAVTIGGTQERAKKDLTRTGVSKVEGLIQKYYLHVGQYPSDLNALVSRPNFSDEKLTEKWAGPYAKASELNDAWGRRLNYEAVEVGGNAPEGVAFKLWSNGPDGQSNTADDITNFQNEKE